MSRNPVDVYGFINAKLRAKIGLMKESHIIEDLLKASSLVEAVSVLRDSQYQRVAEAYDRTGDVQHMEMVLLEIEIEMYREVARFLEGTSATLVRHLLGKIEMDNLKNCIRLWYSSIIRHRPIRYRSEYLFKQRMVYPIDWTALINATSWESVANAIKDSPYYDVVHSYEETVLQQDGLFGLETDLDRLWYMQLMESTKELSAADRDAATSIFLVEIDLKNLLVLTRYGWYHEMPSELLRQQLIPSGRVARSPETEAYLQKRPEERNPLDIINRYFPGLEQTKISVLRDRGNLHQDESSVLENLKIEGYLAERRQRLYRRALASDPFTIGLPLAYFFLFKDETTMVKAILNGKYYGFDEQYIRGVIE
ncbi:V0D/AC39 family V-type ATPase subunit [Sphaerochaeta halotolerans]|uniref:V0D/AC39 family V-type ATPase subunit n=1 Tax=Sphaerochaeta halotolerans TaxID=2293840 RepID=UPI00136FF050|nr:V-type ATPase subunit [Sphaerochaeta halotolerans]MXI87738.1 ATPase [Sphaerochaeta halotolerans]